MNKLTEAQNLLLKASLNPELPTINYNTPVAYSTSISQPNLVVTNFTASTITQSGQWIDVSWTVQNQGEIATYINPWYDGIIYSEDTILGNSDDVYLFFDVYYTDYREVYELLKPNQSYTYTELVQIPRDAIDDGYLFVKTNIYGDQPETNYNDNVMRNKIFNLTKQFAVVGGDPSFSKNIANPYLRNAQFEIVSAYNKQLKRAYTTGKDVWLVFHGWNGDFEQFEKLGQTIAKAKPNDIVLVLDWRQMAHTIYEGQTGLNYGNNFVAASWIRPLAEQIKVTLQNWGLTDGTKLNLVGHDLGTLVSSELAFLYMNNGNPTVNSITALEPPSEMNRLINTEYVNGYDLDFRNGGYNHTNDRPKSFKDVAQFSRAFVGEPSMMGNEEFASWTHESFLVNFNQLTDAGETHGWVVDIFESLIDPDKTDFKFVNNLFTLDNYQQNSNFQQNKFNSQHEGRLSYNKPADGTAKEEKPNYFLFVENNRLMVYGTNKADNINASKLKNGSVSDSNSNLTIISGNGNDTLTGGDNNDNLNGGTDADRMLGRKGKDTYYVDNTGDRVIEKTDEGIDTVRSSITYTLGNNLENLILQSTDSINGTGNTLNNNIIGNSSNNNLSGGNGNDSLIGGNRSDTLVGGVGNDSLTGGNGNDFFRFNSPNEGIDRITDFNVVNDTILISRSGFSTDLPLGTLPANRFRVGSSASTADHRFFYNINNGALFFDVDGNAVTSAVQIATLNTGLAITNADIVVI